MTTKRLSISSSGSNPYRFFSECRLVFDMIESYSFHFPELQRTPFWSPFDQSYKSTRPGMYFLMAFPIRPKAHFVSHHTATLRVGLSNGFIFPSKNASYMSATRSFEKLSIAHVRHAIGSISWIRRPASTIWSSVRHRNPVTPWMLISVNAPQSAVMTGVPDIIASTWTPQNGSANVDMHTTALAFAMSVLRFSVSTCPMTSTCAGGGNM